MAAFQLPCGHGCEVERGTINGRPSDRTFLALRCQTCKVGYAVRVDWAASQLTAEVERG